MQCAYFNAYCLKKWIWCLCINGKPYNNGDWRQVKMNNIRWHKSKLLTKTLFHFCGTFSFPFPWSVKWAWTFTIYHLPIHSMQCTYFHIPIIYYHVFCILIHQIIRGAKKYILWKINTRVLVVGECNENKNINVIFFLLNMQRNATQHNFQNWNENL